MGVGGARGARHGCGRSQTWVWEEPDVGVGGARRGCGRSQTWVWEDPDMGVGGARHGCGRSQTWVNQHVQVTILLFRMIAQGTTKCTPNGTDYMC